MLADVEKSRLLSRFSHEDALALAWYSGLSVHFGLFSLACEGQTWSGINQKTWLENNNNPYLLMTKAMNSDEFGKESGNINEIRWTQKLPERYKRFLEEVVIVLIVQPSNSQLTSVHSPVWGAWLHVSECGTISEGLSMVKLVRTLLIPLCLLLF